MSSRPDADKAVTHTRGRRDRAGPAQVGSRNSKRSNRSSDDFFNPSDTRLVSPIKCPLFDAFCAHQPCLLQNLQMLACGGLADAHLPGDEDAADAVLDE